MSTHTVWISEHDEPGVTVVNDREDMRGNYGDCLDDGTIDPETTSFEDYLSSWQSIEMPDGLSYEAEQRLASEALHRG